MHETDTENRTEDSEAKEVVQRPCVSILVCRIYLFAIHRPKSVAEVCLASRVKVPGDVVVTTATSNRLDKILNSAKVTLSLL